MSKVITAINSSNPEISEMVRFETNQFGAEKQIRGERQGKAHCTDPRKTEGNSKRR